MPFGAGTGRRTCVGVLGRRSEDVGRMSRGKAREATTHQTGQTRGEASEGCAHEAQHVRSGGREAGEERSDGAHLGRRCRGGRARTSAIK